MQAVKLFIINMILELQQSREVKLMCRSRHAVTQALRHKAPEICSLTRSPPYARDCSRLSHDRTNITTTLAHTIDRRTHACTLR